MGFDAMLYQELPTIESTPLYGWGRWLLPALIVAAAFTAALLLLIVRQPLVSAALVACGCLGAAWVYLRAPAAPVLREALVSEPDYTLLGSALSFSSDPVALTTGEG